MENGPIFIQIKEKRIYLGMAKEIRMNDNIRTYKNIKSCLLYLPKL
jgi:hypothetical protein